MVASDFSTISATDYLQRLLQGDAGDVVPSEVLSGRRAEYAALCLIARHQDVTEDIARQQLRCIEDILERVKDYDHVLAENAAASTDIYRGVRDLYHAFGGREWCKAGLSR